MKKVFISYSHKDEEWKNRLLPHLRTLEQQGEISLWDDRKINPGENWYPAIKNELEGAAVAICLISADYLASNFINKEEIPELKQRRSRDGMLLLPILVRPCPWKTVQWLKAIQMFPRDGKSLAEIRGKVNQEKAFAEIAEYVYEKVNDPTFQLAAPPTKWAPPEKVDIDRLPQTGAELFGRQKELQLLDNAWQSDETRVVSLVAWGGVGKSTLVKKWLELMGVENYRGAKQVFGWSFYSQGTKERVTSADKFVSEALAWFGDPDPTKGSPWDKGQRLADLIRQKKTLLILDGLEPLQSDVERGKIKDPALSMLVTQLARKNNGLCVITTRDDVAELSRFDKGVQQLNLDQISKDAGRALLRVSGVQGSDGELEAASEAFGNHALAINLLASYIHDIPGHHISNAAQIEDLNIPEEEGKHPRRVMDAFEKRFGEGPEVQLLRVLGLFDRPVEMDAIKAVYDGPPIKGLTDELVNLTEGQWHNLFEKLRAYKLLARKSTHRPEIVDCHPLVREHFGEKLQRDNPQGWREAHGRLYEYYKALPEKLYGKFLPDTLEEMEPLFAAVAHGCQAGRHEETVQGVYWERIVRGKEFYSMDKLGALGADLAVVSGFFEKPWSKPASGLTDHNKASVLGWAGFALRGLGRLNEASEPMKAGLELRVGQKDWKNAATDASNLSELYLTLGGVKDAVDYARKSVDFADRSGDLSERAVFRFRFANTFLQAAKIFEAERQFLDAEDMWKEYQSKLKYIVSVEGFWFCDLLLDQGQLSQVKERGQYSLKEYSQKKKVLLDMALDKLSLGRAYLLEAVAESRGRMTEACPERSRRDRRRRTALGKAGDFLNQAVDGLREAGQQWIFPPGLLARAELFRYQRSYEKAWADLEEAKEMAERGQMNLYMADYHLEAARLCLAERENSEYRILRPCSGQALNTECRMRKLNEARQHYEEAAKRVNDMGYHRRDPEVLLIQAELEMADGKKAAARKTLETAEGRIEEMGCHRWDIEVERLQGKL